MTPTVIVALAVIAAVAAYWQTALKLLLAGVGVLLVLGVVELAQLLGVV